MPRFTLDFRFVNIERELWALGEFLKVIEPQVIYLREQDRVQTHARLHEEGLEWEDADTQITLQELDEMAMTVFPRLLRNPFIVTLWAAFEGAMVEIADNLASVKKLELGASRRVKPVVVSEREHAFGEQCPKLVLDDTLQVWTCALEPEHPCYFDDCTLRLYADLVRHDLPQPRPDFNGRQHLRPS